MTDQKQTPAQEGPQPTQLALDTVAGVQRRAGKVASISARVWGAFTADIAQGWRDIVDGLKPQAKTAKIAAAPKAKKAKAAKAERTFDPINKRTLAKIAAGNFRTSWRDAFAGMGWRDFVVPDGRKITKGKFSWSQAKSVTSVLGGAVIGGAVGFMAYGLPYVFLTAFYAGAPVIALGIGIRAVGVMIPKGDLKNSVKSIGKKTFATGVCFAMWPMIVVGTVGFAGVNAALTTVETLGSAAKASLRAAYLTLRGRDTEAAEALAKLKASPAVETVAPAVEAEPAVVAALPAPEATCTLGDAPKAAEDFGAAATTAAKDATTAASKGRKKTATADATPTAEKPAKAARTPKQ